eukprot:Unigene9374_Nuclearia_a/m.28616 Unigene9374_Nuclearia_a/g.28616  ORF Unigene9374_Nuclearia_a/g.28616 Unigene9374_Nuclearia_a/m.28616 type:complete len:119 (+) Unigene9374_Nuclearia_a:606-962(+)
MTRTLGLEWGEYGIRTNGIAPGPVGDTPGLTKLSGGAGDDVIGQAVVPLKRVASKFDIAMSVVFLASPAGDYINGHTMVVDGGAWLNSVAPSDRDTIREFSRGVEKKSRAMGIPSAKL